MNYLPFKLLPFDVLTVAVGAVSLLATLYPSRHLLSRIARAKSADSGLRS